MSRTNKVVTPNKADDTIIEVRRIISNVFSFEKRVITRSGTGESSLAAGSSYATKIIKLYVRETLPSATELSAE